MECFLIACFHMLGWNANEEWYDPDQADSRNVPRHQARTLWCGLHSGSFIQETWSVSLDCERARVIVQSVTWRHGLSFHGRPCQSHCVQETWLCFSKLVNVSESVKFIPPSPLIRALPRDATWLPGSSLGSRGDHPALGDLTGFLGSSPHGIKFIQPSTSWIKFTRGEDAISW